MTGGANGFGLDQDRIPVTVHEEVLQDQLVAGGFAFLPELVPRPAPKMHRFRLQRLFEGFTVHVPEHQDRTVPPILDDRRDQALFVELYSFEVSHPFSLWL